MSNRDMILSGKPSKPFFCGFTSRLEASNKAFQYVYIKPYCRIQVYLVGFLLGYVMHRYSNTNSRIPGWVCISVCSSPYIPICMDWNTG